MERDPERHGPFCWALLSASVQPGLQNQKCFWRRRIAGALAELLGRLGLPWAAALFLHASLGAAVTAQYAAVTASRRAAQQRQVAQAGRARATPLAEVAAEADACGGILEALETDSFTPSIWDAAHAGSEIDLELLEVGKHCAKLSNLARKP